MRRLGEYGTTAPEYRRAYRAVECTFGGASMHRPALGITALAMALVGVSGCCGVIRATRDVSLSAPWQQYSKIVVQTSNGRVEITRGAGSNAEIAAKLSVGGLTLANAEERLDQMEITAAPVCDDEATLLVKLNFPEILQQCSPGASLHVQVPTACAAEVCTDNGSICVSDVGPVDLKTSNGRIRAEHIEGNLCAHSSNGRITLCDIDGECRAKTSNGSIEIRSARSGGIDAHTSNGSIEVDACPPADASVNLTTSNGAIHAVLPATMAADLDARTSLGDVDVDFGSAEIRGAHHKGHHLRATMNGGGGEINARTSLGSVTIKFVD
jgi:DUF4097 and DUF4098 domain-containing protein YvlB